MLAIRLCQLVIFSEESALMSVQLVCLTDVGIAPGGDGLDTA
jgi:hypothetical protein